jgi:hypothetical protein
MSKERSAFSFEVTDEQLKYVKDLVEYSIVNHTVQDIFDKKFQYEYRTTGTLGEVAFADAYKLTRPQRSFGADDGQDMGKDFILNGKVIDTKSMRRQSETFYGNYVLNIPSSQLNKKGSLTDLYCCMSISSSNGSWRVAIIGFVDKNKILSKQVGVFYPKGSTRTKADKKTFIFHEDTYEVLFSEMTQPLITEEIKQLPGFKKITINENKNS